MTAEDWGPEATERLREWVEACGCQEKPCWICRPTSEEQERDSREAALRELAPDRYTVEDF